MGQEKKLLGKVDCAGYERWLKHVKKNGEVWAVKPKNFKEQKPEAD